MIAQRDDGMIPTFAERGELFRIFARALFKADMSALYEAVTADFLWCYHDGLLTTKALATPADITAHLAEQKSLFAVQRFDDVAYHHLPDISFMTCRVSELLRSTGEQREQQCIEMYTFKDRRIATKNVFRKPVKP